MRSTNSDDYQHLPMPIVAMAKSFPAGHVTRQHRHPRDQLLYAVKGIMRLNTETDTWIVPPSVAVYIPAQLSHNIIMHNAVEMRSLYIDHERAGCFSSPSPRVIKVSPLLSELIQSLTQASLKLRATSRFKLISSLVALEIEEACDLDLFVPLPKDKRLQLLCLTLLQDPSDGRTLDEWSETIGASPRTLARLFQKELGMGFGPWRQRVRFHHALENLASGMPISKVAKLSGYNSPSAFTSAFKGIMGFRPSQSISQMSKILD
ncbi:MAG: helix-turn-helix transcriptional regulator [Kordiimonadaceae bacterium]|nr:helix-turn-helix transcriptional regulator [Kordiimonadaceae bacterium]